MAEGDDPDKRLADLQKQTQVLTAEKAKFELEKAKLDVAKSVADATPDAELVRLQRQKALADAQKALTDAEKALTDARRASDQASREDARKLTELQSEKALVDAQKALTDSKRAAEQAVSGPALSDLQNQKALLDARKALTEAENQAALAKYIGDVKAGPYSGTVDLKDKAGTTEAALLAAHAINQVAKAVADKVTKKYQGDVHLFALKDFPSFQKLLGFRLRMRILGQAFTTAKVTTPVAQDDVAQPASLPAASTAAAGLDAFAKLTGFLKTDYTLGGVELKLDESLLLFAVAGRLSDANRKVRLPSVFDPAVLTGAIQTLTNELAELARLRATASSMAAAAKQLAAAMERDAAAKEELAAARDTEAAARKQEAVAKAKDAASKDEADTLVKQAAALEHAAAALRTAKQVSADHASRQKATAAEFDSVISLYDTFASALTTPDANGVVPLTAVVQELGIEEALKAANAAILLLRLESAGGGYLVKKNLLTGLGWMPLYHMGGATVTYVLLDGATGSVLAGGTVPFHGGFVRAGKLADHLAKSDG